MKKSTLITIAVIIVLAIGGIRVSKVFASFQGKIETLQAQTVQWQLENTKKMAREIEKDIAKQEEEKKSIDSALEHKKQVLEWLYQKSTTLQSLVKIQ